MLPVTLEINRLPGSRDDVPCLHLHFDDSNMCASFFKQGDLIIVRPETGVKIRNTVLPNGEAAPLRAFTPRDQKAVKTAAQTLRQNPKIDTEAAITEMGVGEALVSFLDEKGRPGIVERAFILPPASRIGPLQAGERDSAIKGSLLYGHYEKAIDRESAYEKLKARAAQAAEAVAPTLSSQPQSQPQQVGGGGILGGLGDLLGGGTRRSRQSVAEAAITSAARAIGSNLGRQIVRGVLGSILGGKR